MQFELLTELKDHVKESVWCLLEVAYKSPETWLKQVSYERLQPVTEATPIGANK